MREFRRGAKSAEGGIKALRKPSAREFERRRRKDRVGSEGGRVKVRKGTHEGFVLLAQFGLMLSVVLRHPLQHLAERWHAVTRFVRKVGAAEERALVVGRQEHRERPAA